MMNDLLRQLLFRSFDEELTEAEAKQLADGLAADAGLRQEKLDLERMRQGLAKLRQPADPAFAQQVIRRLGQSNSLTTKITRLWPAVAAACVLTVSVGLAYILFSEGSLNSEALIGLEDDLMPEEVYVFGDDY